MIVKCEYCHKRVRSTAMKLHLKQCPKAKLARKREYNQRNTHSLEYREDRLKPFVESLEGYDLANITDLQFNALADNLEYLHKQKREKEIEAESKKIDSEMALQAEKLQAMEQAKKDLLKKEQEESERIKQANIEAEKIRIAEEERKKKQSDLALKLEKPEIKENDIEKIEDVIERTLENIKKEAVSLDYYDNMGYRELQKLHKEKYPDKSTRITAEELKAGLRCQ